MPPARSCRAARRPRPPTRRPGMTTKACILDQKVPHTSGDRIHPQTSSGAARVWYVAAGRGWWWRQRRREGWPLRRQQRARARAAGGARARRAHTLCCHCAAAAYARWWQPSAAARGGPQGGLSCRLPGRCAWRRRTAPAGWDAHPCANIALIEVQLCGVVLFARQTNILRCLVAVVLVVFFVDLFPPLVCGGILEQKAMTLVDPQPSCLSRSSFFFFFFFFLFLFFFFVLLFLLLLLLLFFFFFLFHVLMIIFSPCF